MKTSLKVGAAAAVLAVAGLIAVPMAMAQTAPQSVPAATPTTNPSTSTCTTAQHLAWLWKRVPVKLRADITAAKQLPAGAQRDAALKKVLDKASSGAYGDLAKKVATKIAGTKAWTSCKVR